MREVCAIDPASKAVIWRHDSTISNDNSGKRLEVQAFQPLAGGNMMIAESGVGRIIEIDPSGKLKITSSETAKPDPTSQS